MQDPNLSQVALRFLNVMPYGVQLVPDCNLARAQPSDRMRRIGVLMATAADELESQARLAAFLQALQQLGWTDGRNLRIEYRRSAGDAARLRRDAAPGSPATRRRRGHRIPVRPWRPAGGSPRAASMK
jgi:hypothetical protein